MKNQSEVFCYFSILYIYYKLGNEAFVCLHAACVSVYVFMYACVRQSVRV